MEANTPCRGHRISVPSCASDRIYLLSAVTTSMKLKVRSSKRGSSQGATDMSHVHEVASELKHAAISSNYR